MTGMPWTRCRTTGSTEQRRYRGSRSGSSSLFGSILWQNPSLRSLSWELLKLLRPPLLLLVLQTNPSWHPVTPMPSQQTPVLALCPDTHVKDGCHASVSASYAKELGQ